MDQLTRSERAYLRGLAHHLRPAVQIGKEGLTDAALAGIDEALTARELIKVRFVASREAKREIAADIDGRLGSRCVAMIGHVAIIYREHADPARRTIRLPGRAR